MSDTKVHKRMDRSSASKAGFSLIELLSVMAIIAMMMALIAPAFNAIKGGNDVGRSTYDIASTLQEARTYAIANNTYVWVGFFEEDGTKASSTPATIGNGGRVVISVVASQDGTRYSDANIDAATPAAFGAGSTSNATPLVQISRLIKLDNLRLAALNDGSANGGGFPARPGVQAAYQVGDSIGQPPNNSSGSFAQHAGAGANPTTFKYPLGAASPQYTFSKIIEFNPQGEASKIVENVFTGPGPQDAMEIAIVPTHGSTLDPRYPQGKAAAALQIEGITGQVRLYRL
ncbi:hypothetical protein BH09VER1_BH09VER1_03910 [soil metagenome]